MDFESVLDRDSKFEHLLGDIGPKDSPFEKILGEIKPTVEVPPPKLKPISKIDLQSKTYPESFIGRQMKGMETSLGLSKEEFDTLETEVVSQEDKDSFMESVNEIATLAGQPYDVAKGAGSFIMAGIPTFMAGIGGAVSEMNKELPQLIAGYSNLLDMFNAAERGFINVSKYMEPGKEKVEDFLEFPRKMFKNVFGEPLSELLLGKPVDPDLVGELAMVPMTVVETPFAMAAESEKVKTFAKAAKILWLDKVFITEDNIRGVLKFAGFFAGLAALYKVYRGKPGIVEAKRSVIKDVKEVAAKAEKIAETEMLVEKTLEGAVKVAQEKILKMEKQQLELEAKKIAEDLKKEADVEKVVKEDLKERGRKVEEVKSGLRTAEERQVEIERTFEKKEIPGKYDEIKDKEVFDKDEKALEESRKLAKELESKIEPKPEPISITDKIQIKQLNELTKRIEDAFEGPNVIRHPNLVRLKSLLDKDSEFLIELMKKKVPDLEKIKRVKDRIDDTTTALEDGIKKFHKGRETQLKRDAEPDPYLAAKARRILEQEKIEITTSGKYKNETSIKKLFKERVNLIRKMEVTDSISVANNALRDLAMVEAQLRVVKSLKKPITELDRQTGVSVLALEGEKSPFFQTKEKAEAMAKVYEGRKISSVEVLTQKLINDVNRVYHGDKSVDVTKVRNELSEIATRADELNMAFDNPADFREWKATVEEAAIWARRAGAKPSIGYHGTSTKFLPGIEQKGLKPISMKQIVENVLGELGLKGKEKDKVRQTIYEYDYFEGSVKGEEGHRPFDKPDLYITKDIESARDYAKWAGEAYDNALIAAGALDKPGGKFNRAVSSDVAKKVKSLYKKNRAEEPIVLEVEVPGDLKRGDNVYREQLKYKVVEPLRLIEKRRGETTELGIDDPLTFKDESGTTRSVVAKDYREVEEITGIRLNYDMVGEISKNPKLKNVRYFSGIPQSPMLEQALMFIKNKMPKVWNVIDNVSVIPGSVFKDGAGSYRHDIKAMQLTYDPKHTTIRGYVNTIAHELGHAFEQRRIPKEYEGVFAGDLGNKAMRILDREFEKRRDGVELYSGIPLDKAGKLILEGAKRAKEYMDDARRAKRIRLVRAAKIGYEAAIRELVDKSGNIKWDFIDKLGLKGYEIVQKLVLAKGANTIAANKLKQMQREVYGGLTRNEKHILDNLIMYERLLAIAKTKTVKEFNWPIHKKSGKQLTPADAISYAETFSQLEGITPERASIIRRRAKGYFEWMKKPLDDLLKAELISQEEYNNLVSHKYRRIELIDIFDKRYVSKRGRKPLTVYDSGIQELARGRKTNIYEPSSEIMALEVFNRSYGRIARQEANKALLDLSISDPKNPFVRSKAEGHSIPSGWQRIFVFDKGERKALYISEQMSREWLTASSELPYKYGRFMQYVSGSAVLRTFATGIEWGFALANIPRDVMHIYYAARVWEDGKWKSVYSPHLPIFLPQIGMDIARVFPDVVVRGKKTQNYFDYGGGMEFLVHQGLMLRKGKHLEPGLSKPLKALSWFGETSELMTRVAIKEHIIRRRARERGLTVEEARKNKDIQREATFVARDYLDFNQGGGITKAADNAIPYLSATVQATRGLWRTAKDNLKEFVYKTAQIGLATTLVYSAMREQCPETAKALQGSMALRNNLCIPVGDNFGFEDEKGQMRYWGFKVPLDPGQRFFKTFFEAAYDKTFGYEVDIDRITNNMFELSPVGISSMSPTISGSIGYLYNKDLWRNEDVWKKTKPFTFPGSKEEFIPGRTPEFFKDIGELTGVSPERAKHVAGELFTNNSTWAYLMGKGYEKLFADVPKEKVEQHWTMTLSRLPIIGRFIFVTNPYSKYAEKIEEEEEVYVLKRWVENRELDRLAEGYLFEKAFEKEDVVKYYKSFKDLDTRERLRKRFDFQIAIRKLPERSFWLRLRSLAPEVRASRYYDRLKGATSEEHERLMKEKSIVTKAGGFFTEDFWLELRKIRREKE